MRDPHIERLHYKIASNPGIRYEGTEPTTVTTPLGEFELSDGSLVVTPEEHFSSEAQARRAIEPFLRSWEMEADLRDQIRSIRFEFERTDVVDRAPPKPGEGATLNVELGEVVLVGESVSMVLTRKKYPPPPTAFTTTPDVEMAHRRWLASRDGEEPLPAMAYFVLTILLRAAGGLPAAAKTYRIEESILRKIGELSSTRGGPDSARKADAASRPLTEDERRWLEDATKELIQRLGEHASGAPLLPLRLKDLPPP